jgi:hypothetical protein
MTPFDPTLLHDFPDRAIRRRLEEPGNLADLLGAVVPLLAPNFECDRAELQPPAFPLDDWRYRESDLLFLIPYRTGKGRRKVLVCVLIEHQSAPDPRMSLRVLLYTVLFWEREWKAWEELRPPRPAFRLTPVLPIVFHTGPRPWNAARTLAELLRGPEAFRAFVPHYGPLFWDLAEQSPEALLASAAEWLQTLAVIRAEGAERDEFFRVMRQVLERLRGLAGRQEVRWQGLVWFVLAWALQRRPPEEREALIALARDAQENATRQAEVQTMGQTIADVLKEEGRQEGRREGREEGRQERTAQFAQTLQTLLIGVLRDKFGRVPKLLQQQIKATTDIPRLEAGVRQGAKINSLDEFRL